MEALVIQADRAHFYPTQDLMYLHLVVDRKTRRLLGAQGISHNGDALVGRINSIAALLPFKADLADLSNLEVAYAPPFAAALDIVNAVANTAGKYPGRLQPHHRGRRVRAVLLDR